MDKTIAVEVRKALVDWLSQEYPHATTFNDALYLLIDDFEYLQEYLTHVDPAEGDWGRDIS